MAKPTDIPQWDSTNSNSIEPGTSLKQNGVPDGAPWGLEHLNWLFQKIYVWINWLKNDALISDNATEARTLINVYSKTEGDGRYLKLLSNLSDLNNVATARTNLSVYSKAEGDARYLEVSSNLADLNNKEIARSQLDVYSKGDGDARYLRIANNLSDLNNASTARTNLSVYSKAELDGRVATTAVIGFVEKATNAETLAGTADKFPDAASLQYAILNPSSKDNIRVANGIYHARISSTGTTIRIPSGWSVSKTGTGIYQITHNLGTVNYSVVPTIYNNADSAASVMNIAANTFELYTYDANNSSRSDVDNGFILMVDA